MARLNTKAEKEYKDIFQAFHDLIIAHEIGTKRAYEEELKKFREIVGKYEKDK